VAETVPVTHAGDTADDPAIWVHPTEPARSLVIGNDKKGALETYDLSGSLVQRITGATTFWGNVDVRDNLVVAYHGGGIRVYRMNPDTRRLTAAMESSVIRTPGEGLCLFKDAGVVYVFSIARPGASTVRQYELTDTDGDGLYAGTLRRSFDVGSEAEGCVADDNNNALYIAEEDRGLWRYSALPTAGTSRTLIDSVVADGGRIRPDAEGVTIAGNRIILSAQYTSFPSRSYFLVYNRTTNAYVGAFRVTDGVTSDDCDGTDGIAAYSGNLGPAFPGGLFVCQDGQNANPTTRQNFKYVPFEPIRNLT
jgi:myo-inositol-hexaphosphate 3-phosphohydrolase